MLYRKGHASNAATYILEGVLTQERYDSGGIIEKTQWGPGSLIALHAVSAANDKDGVFVSDLNVYISSENVRLLRITSHYAPAYAHSLADRRALQNLKSQGSANFPGIGLSGFGSHFRERSTTNGSAYFEVSTHEPISVSGVSSIEPQQMSSCV